jgi:hypothetical protein
MSCLAGCSVLRWGPPGMRCGLCDPAAPALRASLQCSPQAGSARNSLRSNTRGPCPPEAARFGGAEGSHSPHRIPGSMVERAMRASRTPTARALVTSIAADNSPPTYQRRRAVCPGPAVEAPPSSAAVRGSGLRVFERSEFRADPAYREQRRAAAKRPVTSAGPGHTARLRHPEPSQPQAAAHKQQSSPPSTPSSSPSPPATTDDPYE